MFNVCGIVQKGVYAGVNRDQHHYCNGLAMVAIETLLALNFHKFHNLAIQYSLPV